MQDSLALGVPEAAGAVEHGAGDEVREVARAHVAQTAPTLGALTAGDHPGADHMVTRLDPRHALADFFHHPRALMAGHKRQGHRDAAFQVAEVAVAVPGIQPLDERLAGMRLVELQFLDAIGLVDLSKDSG